MAVPLKHLLKRSRLYFALARMRRDRRARSAIAEWRHRGSPDPPPPEYKRKTLAQYARQFGLRVLVETGTFRGDTADDLRLDMDRVVTVEVDRALFEAASKRFQYVPSVTVLQGDSSRVLPGLLLQLSEPCLFWLDGHHSGGVTGRGRLETPIVQELEAILAHPVKGHVILIDDARCFTGSGGYPTVEAVRDLVYRTDGWDFTVEADIMRLVSAKS